MSCPGTFSKMKNLLQIRSNHPAPGTLTQEPKLVQPNHGYKGTNPRHPICNLGYKLPDGVYPNQKMKNEGTYRSVRNLSGRQRRTMNPNPRIHKGGGLHSKAQHLDNLLYITSGNKGTLYEPAWGAIAHSTPVSDFVNCELAQIPF